MDSLDVLSIYTALSLNILLTQTHQNQDLAESELR